LVTLAEERAMPVQTLVAEIDRARETRNLSSAIRVFVLRAAQGRSSPPGRV
jgi:predicted DNA-binding ribbon-helix-helix protein